MTAGRALLAAGCVFGALYAAALVFEMDFAPAGCCGLSWPTPDPVASNRRSAALDPRGQIALVQRRAALDQLAAAPADFDGWLRLAWADWLGRRALTRLGIGALDMSYDLRPYAGIDTPWRVGFALDNWSRLSPDIQRNVVREVKLAPPYEVDRISAVAAAGARDPAGRDEAVRLGLAKPSDPGNGGPRRTEPRP